MHDERPRTRGRHRLDRKDDEVTRRRSGEANPRGKLERAEGLFRLSPELSSPGDIAFTDALDEVLADWARQVAAGTVGPDVVDLYGLHLRAFSGVLDRLNRPRVCEIDANTVLVWMRLPKQGGDAPARNVLAVRRSAARSFFQTAFCLGITDANPAKAIDLPDRTERYVHPFTDDQINQLKRVCRTGVGDTRNPAIVALMLSGAASMELAFVTDTDVDVANRRVWVHHGGYRHRPRWLPLDDWCLNALTRRIAALPKDPYTTQAEHTFLVNRSRNSPTSTPAKQATVVAAVVTSLLQTAGIHRPGVTRAESIREWVAARVFAETGSVEQVAMRLGMSSLDAAAHIVGHDWVTELTDDGPPAHRIADSADKADADDVEDECSDGGEP